jgi:hypothetical protein
MEPKNGRKDIHIQKKTPFMKYNAVFLMAIVVFASLFTGCVKLSGNSPETPVVSITTLPVPEPATPVPVPAGTAAPRQVVTVIHQVSQVRDIKDSELLFTLQVPVEWNVTTHRLKNPENTEGLMYQTDLVGDNVFFIQTYTISHSQDQNYRDQFRQWSPVPTETTVVINGITCDRFESTAGGTTNVSYVVRKTSANERGYASVLVFSANNSNRFEMEDFEMVVSSFRYFSGTVAGTMPGEEIKKIAVPEDESGSVRSAVGSGSSGSAGSGSSSGGCSRCRG